MLVPAAVDDQRLEESPVVPSMASEEGNPEFSVLEAVAEDIDSWLLVQIACVTFPGRTVKARSC
jgi:hypothetical protein